MKKSIFLAILFLFFSANFSVTVFAADAVFSPRYPSVSVNGVDFRVPSYINADGYVAFRLRDIAYILNGTAAQFNVTENGEAGFWIRRGMAHTVDFTELRHLPRHRWDEVVTLQPLHRAALGIDGEDYPAIVISINIVQSIEDTFFSLHDLSYWLGFCVEIINHRIEITTTPQNIPTPSRLINAQTFPIGSRQVIGYAYTLTVRTAPRNDSRILTFVRLGDEFEILGYNGRFVRIQTANGYGWIFAGFLSRSHTAAEPVFVPPPLPEGIIGRWEFVKLTQSGHLDGEETEPPLWILDYIYWATPTLRVFPDKSLYFTFYGAVEGDLIEIAQNQFLLTNQIAASEGDVWYPDDDRWVRYFPESGLLRYSLFNPSSYMYIHYYFTRLHSAGHFAKN